jgi:adenylate kinase
MASFSGDERKLPNILITGTPGTGKTTTAQLVAEKLSHFTSCEVAVLGKSHNLGTYDAEFDTHLYDEDDEDKLLDIMEPMMAKGGFVVDYHSPEIFPERWFDLVLVLRTDCTALFDRLTARGYNEKKRTENLECEIMQVVLEEARESYDAAMVHEVQSDTIEDMESNVARVSAWYDAWKANKGDN